MCRNHTEGMHSRVYPTYKTKYRVANWASYDRALVERGDVTLWVSPEAIATWEPVGVGTRGGQRQYSDLAIETALTLRLLFHLPLRQTEGFLHSLFGMMGLELAAPDHTTLSRRGQRLDLTLCSSPDGQRPPSRSSTARDSRSWAKASGPGRSMDVRGTRGWKKLHLGVDRSGVIIAHALTEATVDDATTAIELITAVDGGLTSVTGDAAYDTIAFYEMAAARGAIVVVPPNKTARVSRRRPRSSARDRTIKRMRKIGRRRWKKEVGYHRQARVENAFFRYKTIIGGSLRARSSGGRVTEAVIACNVLNQMTTVGRPDVGTASVGELPLGRDRRGSVSIHAPTPRGGGGSSKRRPIKDLKNKDLEAAGVEPASESTSPQDSTCVSASEISCPA